MRPPPHPRPEAAPGRAAGAGRAGLGPELRRALAALLRERARRLRRALPPRVAAGVRLLPILLHASFERRGLSGDAPGVAGLRYRRGWSSLARSFGLPPPYRAQRGRRAADAVLAVPTPAGVDALVLVGNDLPIEELGRLQERLEAAEALLRASGVPLRAVVHDAPRLEYDLEVTERALAFGALVGGALSDEAWAALEATRRPLAAAAALALAAEAGTPTAALAMTLLARAAGPGPLDAAAALLRRGDGARALADPDAFCLGWAELCGAGAPLREAVVLASPESGAGLGALLAAGGALALAAASALRRARGGTADAAARRRREALGPGVPRLLLPAVGARLAELAAAGRLRLDPARDGGGWAVRLASGEVLGRGASPVQARVRALALVTAAQAAHGGPPLHAALDPEWRELAARLARRREAPALLLLPVAGGGGRPGPPLDLLNRGPARALAFAGALAVSVGPGRRPGGRMLTAGAAVRAVVARGQAGGALEIVAAHAAARPIAARLAQVAALVRDPVPAAPVAIEAGGRVLLAHPAGPRAFPLARFAARPRVFAPDPHAPDISLTTGERPTPRAHAPGVVQCRILPAGAGTAALLYADARGAHLREETPLSEAEERLREARAIVRGARPAAALAVRLSDGLEAALRRAGPPAAAVAVAVRGALPWVEVEIAGERFGGAGGLGWPAAAEALLARWPAGADGRVAVSAVTVTARGRPAPPLLALWAAGMARRRLRTHLRRALAAYRTASAHRREG